MTGPRLSRRRTAATAVAAVALVPAAQAGAATLTVTTTDQSSASECSLNDAISSANSNDDVGGCLATGTYGDDTINITATGTMNLTGSLPTVGSNVDINGPGSDLLEIHRQSGGDYRVFSTENFTTSLSGVTITNGRLTSPAEFGAGIRNQLGTLILDDVVVRDNNAVLTTDTGNVFTVGGGIASFGTLTLRHSTIEGNTASAAQSATTGAVSAQARAGGIYSEGAMTIERSTISGNTASASVASTNAAATASTDGGGIVIAGGPATMKLSTVSGNHSAASATAPAMAFETGGGVSNFFSLTAVGDTIANNTAAQSANLSAQGTDTVTDTIIYSENAQPNCDGTVNTDGGFNLESPASCTGLEGALHSDPQLQGLADNGGPTLTQALNQTSPALDAGTDAGETTDQRDKQRPFNIAGIANADDGADIGALEAQDGDGDGVNDDVDGCKIIPGELSAGGCPIAEGEVTIRYSKKHRRFKGTVTTPGYQCFGGRGVDLYRKASGDDKLLAQVVTDPVGEYVIDKRGKRDKRYYAAITDAFRADVAFCEEANSPAIKIK